MQKKILMLGGTLYQTFAVRQAKEMGYYVITADYLLNNPAHKYADEYHNVSTIDKEAVLALAKELQVDGIVSYASEAGAPAAAYVAEQLGLPTSPYESVLTLTYKDKFRKLLQENGFNCPKSKAYTSYEDARACAHEFTLPVMVKPVDNSGSKGINKLTDWSQLEQYVSEALDYSRSKRFLIEEFIVKKGHQISGDAFSVDGKLAFCSFGNEFYDPNCDKDFAPLGECWPFEMDSCYIADLKQQLQRLFTLLGMKTNAYNVEAIVGQDDKVYLLEVAARSGGSLIPQLVKYATGVDMVPYVLKAAMGEDCSGIITDLLGSTEQPTVEGYWSNYMVHSNVTGKFVNITFDEEFAAKHLVEWVHDLHPGEEVHRFRGAQDCIGEFILKYETKEEMFEVIKNIESYIHVEVE